MKIKVQLVPEEVGGYSVFVPALPGCMSQGETKEEALDNIKEAIDLYLERDDEELTETFPNAIVVEIEA